MMDSYGNTLCAAVGYYGPPFFPVGSNFCTSIVTVIIIHVVFPKFMADYHYGYEATTSKKTSILKLGQSVRVYLIVKP